MLLLGSASFSWVCYWPVCLLESSAVLAQCLLDGNCPCGASDSLRPLHPTFSPLKIISHPLHSLYVSLSLWYGSLLGTDQVYDPVSLNQNKAERREQETERQSVLLSKPVLLFTVTTSPYLFLDILYGQKNSVLESWRSTALYNVARNHTQWSGWWTRVTWA